MWAIAIVRNLTPSAKISGESDSKKYDDRVANTTKNIGAENSTTSPEEQSGPTGRYPQRHRTKPDYFNPESSFAAMTSQNRQTVEEAMAMKDEDKWKETIQSEMVSRHDHDTWQIVQLPREAKTLGTRFVSRGKLLQDGTVGKYKARIVVLDSCGGLLRIPTHLL